MADTLIRADGRAAEPPPGLARVPRRRALQIVQRGALLGLVVTVLVVGLFGTNSWIDIVNQAMIASIGALALNMVLGHTGLVSIGNAALLGVGGLAAVQVAVRWELGFVPALLFGGLVAAVAGLLIALPSMRIKGLYLAMATLAFHFVAVYGIREIQTAQVGNRGYLMPRADLFGWELRSVTRWYWFLLAVLVVWMVAYRSLLRGKPGRAWRAIREQVQVASMSGVSVRHAKIAVFVISSFVIGVAGAAFAYYVGAFSWESYTLHLAIVYLAMIIVGGLGSMYGPILGAFAMTLLPDVVSAARNALGLERAISGSDIFLVQGAIVGAVIVLIIIVEPRGLASIGDRVTSWLSQDKAAS